MERMETKITEELVERKIAAYFNVGDTIAPEPILSLLQARCRLQQGRFLTPEQAAERKGGDKGEKKAEKSEKTQQAPGEAEVRQNGIVKGIVGKRMVINGVLDLRGVPGEQLSTVEKLLLNGVALMDEGNRAAWNAAAATINGSVMTVPPDMQVMMQPDMELSKAAVEAMPSGQKMMILGNVFIRTDVPPALIADRFTALRLVGIAVMGEAVQGVLFGKGDVTGITVAIPAEITHVVRSMENRTWTADYLRRLPDGSAYVNVGNTTIPA